MSYVRVGADPSLLKATLATSALRSLTLPEPPPLHWREEKFLVKRLSDIKKYNQDKWQGFLEQGFVAAVFPNKGVDGHLAAKWKKIPGEVTAVNLLNMTPPSARQAIYKKAGVKGAFYNYLMSKWPPPPKVQKTVDVQSMTKAQIDALTPEQKAEREKADARAQAYAEGRVQEVTKTDAQGNKTTFVKDPESGQFVPKDTPAGQEAIDKAAGVAGGLLDKIPGGLITVAAAGGLVLFLVLRRK